MILDYLYIRIIEISSMSAYELVSIEASFTSMVTKLDCKQRAQDQINRYKKDGLDIPPERMAEINKCPFLDKEMETSNVTFGKGSCLCQCKNPNFGNYFTLYEQFDKGSLPDVGPLLDQPAQIVDCIKHIQHLKMDHENEEHKKRDREAKAKNKGKR